MLPEWYEGVYFKSLKKLGLDTSQTGPCLITGLYMEIAGKDDFIRKGTELWGGDIATNTITVELAR